ncbi:MAG: endonuclease/exonuclease/phosphatase family protein [Sphaerochaeta sp.]|nr:endonuclease/exonuclease/phosphatase family protein [Sphaerochaeta sp.]
MTKISITSLNLWNTEHWSQRETCVVSFVQTYQSDIYCFQEVRSESLAVLDSALPSHQRIQGKEPGWTCESTIYLKKDFCKVIDFGLFPLTMPEIHRGLFWIRIQLSSGKEMVVCTMHLTHQLNADEARTGVSYRHQQAHEVASFLNRFDKNLPTVICGDFNDPIHPSRILQEKGDFRDVFSLLGLPAPITFPCPFLSDELFLVEAIDRIMIRGAVRALIATSPHFHMGGQVLSDHWPVMAMLEL